MNKWIRYSLALLAIGLLTMGCSSAQATSIQAPTPAATLTPLPAATVAAATPTAVPSPTEAPTTAPSVSPANTTAGTGTVALQVVEGQSNASYRVREQLASLSLPSDAVGTTKAITGTIVGKTDGSIDPALSKFVVDLRTLQSDRSQRDNFLRRNVLETDQYPYATFVPNQAPGLPLTFPPTGQVAFKLVGDLTIRNVTKPVTWDVTCQPQTNQGTCHATTSFTFEYFDLTQPRVSVVLSVVDNITLELNLVLQPASS